MKKDKRYETMKVEVQYFIEEEKRGWKNKATRFMGDALLNWSALGASHSVFIF